MLSNRLHAQEDHVIRVQAARSPRESGRFELASSPAASDQPSGSAMTATPSSVPQTPHLVGDSKDGSAAAALPGADTEEESWDDVSPYSTPGDARS